MLDKILWLSDGNQKRIFLRLSQPTTAIQLSHQMGIPSDQCSYLLARMAALKLMRCLNPYSRRSRLYWFTRLGKAWQRRLRHLDRLPPIQHDFPDLDWSLYGDVCYSHRATVVKTLGDPMQPAQIKRRALQRDATIRMSANNARDVVRFLYSHGVIEPVMIRKKAFPRYRLTEIGKHFQRLLLQSEVRK